VATKLHRNDNYDRNDKMKLYRRSGVPEYWIIDPKSRTIEVYVLQEGEYNLASFAVETGDVSSTVLPGLTVSVQQVFTAG